MTVAGDAMHTLMYVEEDPITKRCRLVAIIEGRVVTIATDPPPPQDRRPAVERLESWWQALSSQSWKERLRDY